jgi:hypothetical protein
MLFAVGSGSLFALYTLYAQQVVLARGIILMGAVSILGGSAYGALVRGNRLDKIECFLLTAIALLLGYRIAISR